MTKKACFFCPKCGTRQSVKYEEGDVINILGIWKVLKVECVHSDMVFLLPLESPYRQSI